MGSDRILVTGATGFVGRHFVSHILATSDRTVTLAVRDRNLCLPVWRDNAQVRIVETGAIQTATNLDTALADVSDVVHLAGFAHAPSSLGEEPFVANNAVVTQRLAQASAAHRVRSFIHLSSLAAITKNATLAVINDETDNTNLTPYGQSKRDAENHVRSLEPYGILAVSLRPPLVVGHEARGNWAALQRLAATGVPLPFAAAMNRRSLISVRSLVEAIQRLCLVDWPSEKSGNYCIADEEPLSIPIIITLLRAGMGQSPRLFPFPPVVLNAVAKAAGREHMASGLLGELSVDASRFRRAFEFTSSQNIADAITEAGRLYRQNAGQD